MIIERGDCVNYKLCSLLSFFVDFSIASDLNYSDEIHVRCGIGPSEF